MASKADWDQAPVLMFEAVLLDAEHGGSSFLMELLALTGGYRSSHNFNFTIRCPPTARDSSCSSTSEYGENQAIAAAGPSNDLSRCPLCSQPL